MNRLLGLIGLAACVTGARASLPSVAVTPSSTRVGMGRTLKVTAAARLDDGKPASGRLLLPYVNGRRWGHHEYADAAGKATFLLPMPNPGPADIQVALDGAERPTEEWIWSDKPADAQTVRFEKTFHLPCRPRDATLWVVADDRATVTVNGRTVGAVAGWATACRVPAGKLGLRPGRNVIAIEAFNHAGPAGLLVRLVWTGGASTSSATASTGSATASGVIVTDRSWRASVGGRRARCVSFGKADQGLWSPMMRDWPTVTPRDRLIAGHPMPNGAIASRSVRVEVFRRPVQTIKGDGKRLVGIQWEPWFTPLNAAWTTAQAVPLCGFYWSWNRDVTRQHMLWLIESGVDFLVVDWTNHLWDRSAWDDRPDATNEIIHSTTLALETLATMRDEGISVPKMVLLLGLTNGPSTTMEAVNEEMAWIHHTYVRNPRFAGLFLDHDGKPLILLFNGGGPGWLIGQGDPLVDDRFFTVRWCSSQHQVARDNEHGYWSWMDGTFDLPVTMRDGAPEAMTASVGFFGPGGWLARGAYGRRNGWTLAESFQSVMRVKPRYLQIHQFQEFAGQPEGQGYGPERNVYVDSYSSELSDDVEPTSPTTPAYRGEGGWGFSSLNMLRALVDLYRQDKPETSVVAIGAPLHGSVARGPSLAIEWTLVGCPARGFRVTVTGLDAQGKARTATRVEPAMARRTSVALTGMARGPLTVSVVAEGTRSRYRPSWTEDSLPLAKPVEAYAEVVCRKADGASTAVLGRARGGNAPRSARRHAPEGR
jgi:hypothetical protein